MSDKPIQWEILVSMEAVQAEHPEWTEEQCREEFNRLARAGVQKMLDEQEARRAKRKRKVKP
jgi:hypothetical protein